MQQVKNIVKGPYEPQDNTVIWIDTSNPDAPIAKVHSNGEWKATSGGEIVTEIDKDSTDEQIPTAKAANDIITMLANEVGVDLDKYKEYFTIEATEDDTTIYFRQSQSTADDGLDPLKVEVSTDDGATWTEVTAAPAEDNVPGATLASLDAGEKVLVRGNNSAYGYYSDSEESLVDYCNFWSDQPCYVYGNIMSLIGGNAFSCLSKVSPYSFYYFFSDFSGDLDGSWVLSKDGSPLLLPATTLGISCYSFMFTGCTSLTTAPVLPAIILEARCYQGMFYGCTSLTTTPAELPATALAYSCYNGMFRNCTSLVAAPALPATTLADGCYNSMFFGCTSLTKVPVLPATTLMEDCYDSMFYGCTSLITAPELPATTLTEKCYYFMFSNCTSLTAAPELPATTLEKYCYYSMFSGCSNLSYIKALFTTTPTNSYTQNWVQGVKATGTFVKSSSATWDVTGTKGVPNGWTTKEQDPAQRNDQADWKETNSSSASYIWNKPIVDVSEYESGDDIPSPVVFTIEQCLAVMMYRSIILPRMSLSDAYLQTEDHKSIAGSIFRMASEIMEDPVILSIFGTIHGDEDFVTSWTVFAIVEDRNLGGTKIFVSEE